MGYTTEFRGAFHLDKTLFSDDYKLLRGLATTRRMARNVGPEYGVEGEFYIDGKGSWGQEDDGTVLDHNRPPKTQPGLWCQWIPTDDGKALEWDGGEKFYEYVEWLQYLLDKVLIPRGYKLNGSVRWRGEDFDDMGTIHVIDNVIRVEYK